MAGLLEARMGYRPHRGTPAHIGKLASLNSAVTLRAKPDLFVREFAVASGTFCFPSIAPRIENESEAANMKYARRVE